MNFSITTLGSRIRQADVAPDKPAPARPAFATRDAWSTSSPTRPSTWTPCSPPSPRLADRRDRSTSGAGFTSISGVGNRGQARRLPPERRHPVRQLHGQRRDVAPAPMPRASAKRRYLGEGRLGQPDLPGLSEFGRLRGRRRLPPRLRLDRRHLGATGRHRVPNRASPPR